MHPAAPATAGCCQGSRTARAAGTVRARPSPYLNACGGRCHRRRNTSRRRDGATPLAHLLAPHRVVEAALRQQLVVTALLDNATALEDVDAIGVHDRGETVRDQNSDRVAGAVHLA